MLLHIENVLDRETLARCRQLLDNADWADGRMTSGWQSRSIKNNQQLRRDDPVAREVGQIIVAALNANSQFFSAALPRRMVPPMFNRYGEGMYLGNHIDNAVQGIPGTDERIRGDVSATLFFSDPDEYDGGELLIEDTYGVHSVKLPAGDMVLYPSTSLHRVETITRGARVASFFWIESMVRDVGERGLLFDLDTALCALRADGENAATTQLTGVYHNLLRRWATP